MTFMDKDTPTAADLIREERTAAVIVAHQLIEESGFRLGITGIGFEDQQDSTTRRAIESRWPERPITNADDFEERFTGNPRARGVMVVHGVFDLPGINTWALDFDDLPGLESMRYLQDLGIVTDDDCTLWTPHGAQIIFEHDYDRGFKNWTAHAKNWSFDPALIPGPEGDGRLPGVDIRVGGGNSQVFAARHDGTYRFAQMQPQPLHADLRLYGLSMAGSAEPLPPIPRTPMEAASRSVYASKALLDEYSEMSRLTEGARNASLNSASFSFARRFIADGSLERHIVERAFEDAAVKNGVAAEDGIGQVRASIRSGIDDGLRQAGIERGYNALDGLGEASA